jgi:hypothetical protein
VKVVALFCAVLMLTGASCSPNRVKPSIVDHTPVEVSTRVMVPVRSELTAPLPCYERKDESVREYIAQAENNTATCKTANAHRQAIRDSHPED